MIQDQGRRPARGWHKDVPFSEYLGWDCVNASLLKAIRRSPAHAKHAKDNGRDDTDALRVGRAIHSVILEPDKFHKEFACAPECDRRTSVGKAKWASFVEGIGQKTALKVDEYEMVMRMHESVLAHPKAKELLTARGEPELSLAWEENGSGLWCKARMDYVLDDADIVVDVKSTDSADEEGFARSVLRYGYHVQDAFYRKGYQALKDRWPQFVFIAVEKEPPYGVACYSLPGDVIRRVTDEVEGSLHRLRGCMETNDWPGYGLGITELVLPAWAS